MIRLFPSLRFALMVGIGGGALAPERDIRLGDAVVSMPQGKLGGVIQYNFGKKLSNGQFQQMSQLNSPPEVLLGVIFHTGGITCASSAINRLEERPLQVDKRVITVHYSIITSVNSIIKNAEERDKYTRGPELNSLSFEIEAAGLMNNFPCLVIQRICGYSGSHKTAEWHRYAALAAAAYARELLPVLKPLDYGAQQSDYFGNRQQGTGQWFLESTEYREWIEADGKTLFCPGIPGAGETILSSIVINDLYTRFSHDPNIGIAYIYCNFRREQEQKIVDLLASLLKQLSRGWYRLPESVNSLYDKHKKNATRPLLGEVSAALKSVVGLYVMVFITVDALDECQALDDCRGIFLSEIFRLQGKFMVNICATSRPISDVAIVKTNPRLQEQIKTGISEAVGGMFLLAHIYLQFLKDKVTENDVRSALEGIQKQKERINRQEMGLREFAILVLSWITCVKRQLTTIELQHALGTKKGNRSLDTRNLVPIESRVSVCAGLVTVDKKSDIIQLAHYTTQQYFNGKQNELFPNVRSNMTTACVTYLSFDAFGSGLCRTDQEFEERMRLYPFYHYTTHHLGDHARQIPSLRQEAADFLESGTKVEACVQSLMYRNCGYFQVWKRDEYVPQQMTGLHLAAYLGIKDGVQILTIRNPMNHRDRYNSKGYFWLRVDDLLKGVFARAPFFFRAVIEALWEVVR
ncbi:hypothetical protein EDB82DRAFT_565832 [Fusarium venenatum]|uniref:uncharacterized protein n=1 Tax=Fusarium venenatum TaxID=56646 RepID=UPI001D564D5E|nr:hypothetical protein EDB82DRAFT_565832 [Fusarium venenatum]